jgi:uncharacterized membrane protein
VWLYQFIDKNIATHINRMNTWIASRVTNYPADGSRELREIRQELGDTGVSPDVHQQMIEEARAEYARTGSQQAYERLLVLLSHPVRSVTDQQARLAWWRQLWQDWPILQFTGFVVAVVLVYFAGFFFATYLGRGVWRLLEALMKRIPVVKQIYPYVKQITDFVLSEQKVEFRRVVAVQYPRRGIWSLGFVTGPGLRTVQEATALHLVSVFIPSSPTPVTGYVILVRREDIIDVPLAVDAALRFVISGGVIMPPSEVPPLLDEPVVVDADPETVTIESCPPPRPLPPAGEPC